MNEHTKRLGPITDRYRALGVADPDVDTTCKGQCEGIGRYPQTMPDPTATEYERAQWELEEATNPGCDTHFIVCGDCNGTGKR